MAVTGRQACLMNSASFKNYFKFVINCLGKMTKMIQAGLIIICLFFLLIIKESIIKIFLDFESQKAWSCPAEPMGTSAVNGRQESEHQGGKETSFSCDIFVLLNF